MPVALIIFILFFFKYIHIIVQPSSSSSIFRSFSSPQLKLWTLWTLSPHFPLPPTTIILLSVSRDLIYKWNHRIYNVCLTYSCSIMFLMFIHVVAYVRISFLFKANIPLYGCSIFCSEKAMAPHSSTLAWKIPWTEEPGGLQSMVLHRVGRD